MLKIIFMTSLLTLFLNNPSTAQEIIKEYHEFEKTTSWMTELKIDETSANFTYIAIYKAVNLGGVEFTFNVIIRRIPLFVVDGSQRLVILIGQKRFELNCVSTIPSLKLATMGMYLITPEILNELAYGQRIRMKIYGLHGSVVFTIPLSQKAIIRNFYEKCVKMEE